MHQNSFFNLGPPPKVEDPKTAARARGGCFTCGLAGKEHAVTITGQCKEGVLILAEAPTTDEQITLEAFSAKKYKPLWDLQGARFTKDILQDCAIGYAVMCPSKDAYPNDDNIVGCRKHLLAMIEELKPKVIIPMGPAAIKMLIFANLSGRIKGVKPTDFIGYRIPDRKLNAWICPTYSPDFIQLANKKDNDQVPRMFFEQHIRTAWLLRNKEFPWIPSRDNMSLVTDPKVAAGWLSTIQGEAEGGEIAFDYETTGKKPHREGHKIKCASVAWTRPNGVKHAVAFPWAGDNEDLLAQWKELVLSEKIGKIAHKIDFESSWTHFRAGPNDGPMEEWMENWSWDTCLAAHCIRNEGRVGLKFLVYVYLGIVGYDVEADHWITTTAAGEDKASCNSFNLLGKGPPCPPSLLLPYCADDSLYSLMIKEIQEQELSTHQMEGFRFFLDSASELAIIQNEGLPVDMEMLNTQWAYCTEKIEEATKTAARSPEVKKWTKGSFSPTSPQQLAELLYDVVGHREVDGKGRSTDEKVLKKIGSPVCIAVLAIRRWIKIRDTFLAGIKREAVQDKETGYWFVRPFFNLSMGAGDEVGGPKTFRSSSDSPNLQNVPKRDPEMKAIIRSVFKALPDEYIEEFDYKGVEVAGGACVHKDPVMIDYINDPRNNMHTDTAADMFFRDKSEVPGGERHIAKNGQVFPSFYGSMPANIAASTWEMMDTETRKRLKQFGINTFDQWKTHMFKVNDIFWNSRFKVYSTWKRDTCWKFYQAHGYVELLTGFRCYGPARFTQVTNSPIQGPSFHILLWVITQVNRWLRKNGYKSRMCCQIHDAMVPRTHKDELDIVMGIIHKYGIYKVRDHWDWIIVPLTIEGERSLLGGTWAKMEETGALEE